MDRLPRLAADLRKIVKGMADEPIFSTCVPALPWQLSGELAAFSRATAVFPENSPVAAQGRARAGLRLSSVGRRWFTMLTALQHITDVAVTESKKVGDDKVCTLCPCHGPAPTRLAGDIRWVCAGGCI
jgi:hypothetical protein